MKKYLYIVAAIGLMVVGCSDPVTVDAPSITPTKKVEWINIDNNSGGLSIEATRTWSKTINGGIGGTLKEQNGSILMFLHMLKFGFPLVHLVDIKQSVQHLAVKLCMLILLQHL